MLEHGFPKDWSTLKKLIWLFRSTGGSTPSERSTITGTSPLSLLNALAKPIKSLIQHGKCTVSGSDITCNNGVLSVVDGEIVVTGTPEEIVVSASGADDQTATAENLFAVDTIEDTQDIITGKVTRRCEPIISDGTTPSGRFIGTVGEGNILVKVKETGYTGAIASFEADKVEPLNGLVCEINPVQDLHGYDSPWPAGGGKNKYSGDTITLEKPDNRAKNIPINPIPVGDYTVSWVSNATNLTTLSFRDENNNALGSVTVTTSGDKTISFTAPCVMIYAYISTNAPDGATATISNIQIETGDTPTAWSPYSNLCPIYGNTGVDVTQTGKNLVRTKDSGRTNSGVTYTVNEDGSIVAVGTASGSSWFRSGGTATNYGTLLRAGSYSLSGGISQNEVLYIVGAYIDGTPITSSVVSGNIYDRGSGATFTLLQDAYISYQIQIVSGTTTNALFKPMLRIASDTDNTWKPYTGTTYPITFPDEAGTVYSGTLDVVSGVLTVTHKSYIFDGTERWDLWNGVFVNYDLTDAKKSNVESFTNKIIFADRFKSNGVTYRASCGDGNIIKVVGDNTQIACYSSAFVDENAFKASLANNPMTCVYELATPITYQLTPQEVDTLVGQNNIFSDTNGDTTAYVSDGITEEKVAPQKLTTSEGDNTITVTAEVEDIVFDVTYVKEKEG